MNKFKAFLTIALAASSIYGATAQADNAVNLDNIQVPTSEARASESGLFQVGIEPALNEKINNQYANMVAAKTQAERRDYLISEITFAEKGLLYAFDSKNDEQVLRLVKYQTEVQNELEVLFNSKDDALTAVQVAMTTAWNEKKIEDALAHPVSEMDERTYMKQEIAQIEERLKTDTSIGAEEFGYLQRYQFVLTQAIDNLNKDQAVNLDDITVDTAVNLDDIKPVDRMQKMRSASNPVHFAKKFN